MFSKGTDVKAFDKLGIRCFGFVPRGYDGLAVRGKAQTVPAPIDPRCSAYP